MQPGHCRALLSLLIVSGVAACGDDHGATAPNPPPSTTPSAVSVALSTDAPGPRIPADFLGLGFETTVMADPLLSSAPGLEQLLRNLGPGTLRFGGNSVQHTVWRPTGLAKLPLFQLTPADVDATLGFARRVGWRVTVAMALSPADPSGALAEAAYLAQSGGDALLAVEIGNEPNLFPLNGIRSPGYSVDSFTTEFDASAGAIHAQLPHVPLAAPSTWCTGGGAWFAEFLDKTRTPLAFATHHFYPMGVPAPANSDERATVENMLSPELMARTRACVDSAVTAAATHGVALRVDETNSAFGFGQPGVSDVFASALWGIDHLYTLAELGVAGVNVQTGTNINGGLTCKGIYLPVCDQDGVWVARPLYYAMLLFHEAAVGRSVPVQVTAGGGSNFVAHATVSDDGIVRVALINKEASTAADVTLEVRPAPAAAATALRLLGPSLVTSRGATLGGAAVAPNGTWAPVNMDTIAGQAGNYAVTVPAASAALLTVGLP
jgi:Glycosyl hydrolase family 79, N-terminal domain